MMALPDGLSRVEAGTAMEDTYKASSQDYGDTADLDSLFEETPSSDVEEGNKSTAPSQKNWRDYLYLPLSPSSDKQVGDDTRVLNGIPDNILCYDPYQNPDAAHDATSVNHLSYSQDSVHAPTAPILPPPPGMFSKPVFEDTETYKWEDWHTEGVIFYIKRIVREDFGQWEEIPQEAIAALSAATFQRVRIDGIVRTPEAGRASTKIPDVQLSEVTDRMDRSLRLEPLEPSVSYVHAPARLESMFKKPPLPRAKVDGEDRKISVDSPHTALAPERKNMPAATLYARDFAPLHEQSRQRGLLQSPETWGLHIATGRLLTSCYSAERLQNELCGTKPTSQEEAQDFPPKTKPHPKKRQKNKDTQLSRGSGEVSPTKPKHPKRPRSPTESPERKPPKVRRFDESVRRFTDPSYSYFAPPLPEPANHEPDEPSPPTSPPARHPRPPPPPFPPLLPPTPAETLHFLCTLIHHFHSAHTRPPGTPLPHPTPLHPTLLVSTWLCVPSLPIPATPSLTPPERTHLLALAHTTTSKHLSLFSASPDGRAWWTLAHADARRRGNDYAVTVTLLGKWCADVRRLEQRLALARAVRNAQRPCGRGLRRACVVRRAGEWVEGRGASFVWTPGEA